MRRAAPTLSRGFTLVELMVAVAVSAIMFGFAIETGISLERMYNQADLESAAISDEERAIDYITRDLRCAYSVTLSGGNQTLTLLMPDCYTAYDAQGNPSGPIVTPTISNTTVNYNDPAKPVTVSYQVTAGQLIRQVTIGATGATGSSVISTGVVSLQSAYADLTSIVTVTLSFQPQLSIMSPIPSARAGAQLTTAVSVRNVRRD